MPPRSERPFEEKLRCWFEKCILPVSLFTVPPFPKCAPTRDYENVFAHGLDLTVKPPQALPWARSSSQNASRGRPHSCLVSPRDVFLMYRSSVYSNHRPAGFYHESN